MTLSKPLSISLSKPLSKQLAFSVGVGFSPSSLFSSGESGAYFDLSKSSIFQDSGATTAAAVGDPVGYVEDLSGNDNHFTQATDADRPILREDANGKKYLEIGLNADSIDFAGLGSGLPSTFSYLTAMQKGSDDLGTVFGAKSGADYIGVWQANLSNDAAISGFTATVDSMELNSVDISADKRGNLLDKLNASGNIVFSAQLSSVSTTVTGWNMGDANQSVLQSDMNVYGAFWIDRALTTAELADMKLYMGKTFNDDFSVEATPIDLIMSTGQSNAEGRGNDGTIPLATTTHGIEIDSSGDIVEDPMVDPVGGAVGSSMWPAFANEWFAQTGNDIAIVDAAVGSSDLIPDATASWGSSGSARANAKTYAAAAQTTLGNNVNYSLGDTVFVWVQGETEVLNDNGTTITATVYEPALESLAADFNTNVTGFAGLKVMQLAPRFSDSTQLAGQLVSTVELTNEYNTAIQNAADDSANITMAYEGASSYPSLGYMADDVHWNTQGLQEAAKAGAIRINGNSTPPTVTSPYIGITEYIDTANSDKSSRTQSHTTAATNTCLIVCVSAGAYSTTSNDLFLDATFDGVTMARAGMAFTEGRGQATAAVFVLNEDMYGSSLGGVTGDIVVNSRLLNGTAKSINILNIAAIDAKDVYRVDRIEGNNATTATDTASHTIAPTLNSLLVNVTAANLNSLAPSSATVTNLTEVADSSFTRAKTTQMVVAHAESAAQASTSPSIVFGDTMQEIASITVALRGKITGES